MNEEIITKNYLKMQNACEESYGWLQKQKNKYWITLSNNLYLEKRYDWCLWLLYRKTILAKFYVWLPILLSILLAVFSIYLNINNQNFSAFVAVFASVSAFVIFAAFAIILAIALVALAVHTSIAKIVCKLSLPKEGV